MKRKMRKDRMCSEKNRIWKGGRKKKNRMCSEKNRIWKGGKRMKKMRRKRKKGERLSCF
jgi:hypothetical protein